MRAPISRLTSSIVDTLESLQTIISSFFVIPKANTMKRPGESDAESIPKKLSLFDSEEPARTDSVPNEQHVRLKKRMFAVLMMYSGWGYFGMQRMPTHPTIEGELSKALMACGYLDDFSGEAHKKLPEKDGVADQLNDILPKEIRILDVIRVTRSFHAHTACSSRIYDYVFPTFALAPNDLPGEDAAQWAYRLSAERLNRANEVLARYRGTHNFYNFTSGRLPTDSSCARYIISIECLPPQLLGDCEYGLIRICGQSFMLHQIRKMIGLVMAIVRGTTSEEVFDNVFGTERMDVPKAPGLGLMLNQVVFTRYNEKFGSDNMHTPIDWSKYEKQMETFRREKVYEHIHQTELEQRSMLGWLESMDKHTYTFRAPSSPSINRTQFPADQTLTAVGLSLPLPSPTNTGEPDGIPAPIDCTATQASAC